MPQYHCWNATMPDVAEKLKEHGAVEVVDAEGRDWLVFGPGAREPSINDVMSEVEWVAGTVQMVNCSAEDIESLRATLASPRPVEQLALHQ